MKIRTILWALAISLVVIGCQTQPQATNEPAEEPKVDAPDSTAPDETPAAEPAATTVSFSDVETVLQRCTPCHSGDSPPEGLNLTSYEGLMKGTEHEKIVVPGEPEESEIIMVMRGDEGHPRMPPKGDPVSADDIQKVADWIEAGAEQS